MAEKNSSKRYRVWTVVLYPDSAPDNWMQILDDLIIPWACSPLHDKDSEPNNPAEFKKAHWHIILAFGGPKSFEQVSEMLNTLNSPHPQYVSDIRSMIRYLVHIDHPHKHQYPISEIACHNGFDTGSAFTASASERHDYISEMMRFCYKTHITEFSDLCLYALENRKDDWFPLLCDNSAVIMSSFVKSLRYKFNPLLRNSEMR